MPESFDSLEARLHDLGGFIRDQRRNARLSLRKLSELAGISNPYLSQIERGLRNPSAEILQSIARGLRISAETLYVRAGILDASAGERSSGDPVGAIVADPTINDRQKQALDFQRTVDKLFSFRGFRGEADDNPIQLARTFRRMAGFAEAEIDEIAVLSEGA